jgi:hypothetical protein
MLSPISASTSPTWSGGTPNFSRTSAGPSKRFFMVSSRLMRSLHICIRSLSDEQITTRMPSFAARQASVAMTSSASTPGSDRLGNSERIDHPVDDLHLGGQIRGHGRPVSLVVGVQVVAEVAPGGIEHGDQVRGPVLPLHPE